ncbi:serine/threonine protein kinase [Bacillus wiedmannii]|uniref:serine/threonine protein kinase n=2 Tax=Bacillus wiedmannii TaxID=1890302 RepID=UPI0015D494D8|nr:serine/threonine-protein kinase [Bacillus wiedmannii]MED3319281.1 serine/threonine-protein kinase [Bacillus wiedmannii]
MDINHSESLILYIISDTVLKIFYYQLYFSIGIFCFFIVNIYNDYRIKKEEQNIPYIIVERKLYMPIDKVFDGERNSYKVQNEIGRGGFGQVYKIEKEEDGSHWALKILPPYASSEKELIAFKNESQMALKVSHENTMNYKYIHDGSTYESLPSYIIMELANGGSLKEFLQQKKKNGEFLNNETLHQMFNQLVNGMEHINSELVHRDIKPDNILINDGNLIITDFGLGKIVDAATRNFSQTFKGYGTKEYVAPEGWRSESNTIQMDIYAMGMTFYEMATLEKAFNVAPHATYEEWKHKHLHEVPITPNKRNTQLTSTISQVIMKMIEKRLSRRYQTWSEIRKDLALDSLPKTDNQERVDFMLQHHMERTSAQRSKELEAEKVRKEKMEFEKLIYSQFQNDIYEPIKDFVDEFNKRCVDGKVLLQGISDTLTSFKTSMRLPSDNLISIDVRILRDEDFMRHVPRQMPMPYESRTIRRLQRPIFPTNNKKVLAWGYIKNKHGIGYNLLLLEDKDELYGEWVMLSNSVSGLGIRENRPNQFVFEFDELEKEIQLVQATHIFNTEVIPFDIEKIQEFIAIN